MNKIQSQSYNTAYGQLVICGQLPDFYYCRTFAVYTLWDALPDERKGL
jgi:hypothetical protein